MSDTPIFTDDMGIPAQCKDSFVKMCNHVRSMPDHVRQEAKDNVFDQMCIAVRVVAGILSSEESLPENERTTFVNYLTDLHLSARAFGDTDIQKQTIKMAFILHKIDEDIAKEGK